LKGLRRPAIYLEGFPLYFTTSKEEAYDHAWRKPTDERYLLHLEVPFGSLDKVEATALEVARNHEQMDFRSQRMYFNQENGSWDSLEWISKDIPQEWISEIQELD